MSCSCRCPSCSVWIVVHSRYCFATTLWSSNWSQSVEMQREISALAPAVPSQNYPPLQGKTFNTSRLRRGCSATPQLSESWSWMHSNCSLNSLVTAFRFMCLLHAHCFCLFVLMAINRRKKAAYLRLHMASINHFNTITMPNRRISAAKLSTIKMILQQLL